MVDWVWSASAPSVSAVTDKANEEIARQTKNWAPPNQVISMQVTSTREEGAIKSHTEYAIFIHFRGERRATSQAD